MSIACCSTAYVPDALNLLYVTFLSEKRKKELKQRSAQLFPLYRVFHKSPPPCQIIIVHHNRTKFGTHHNYSFIQIVLFTECNYL